VAVSLTRRFEQSMYSCIRVTACASSDLWRGGRVLWALKPCPLLPGTSLRIPSCGRPPVLFPGETCIPVDEVSPPQFSPPSADFSLHRRHSPP